MLDEDDYENEEQPANIRDRVIPGRNAPHDAPVRATTRVPRARSAPSAPSAPREPRAPRAPRAASREKMPEAAQQAQALLVELLAKMGVEEAQITYYLRPEGEYLEVDAPDLGMLIGKHGQTLESVNLLFNNMINAGVRSNRHYFTIDAEGYRARRADRLRELAMATLERVVAERKPQRLEPMLPSERKIIHIALSEYETVRTESEGEEPERCLVVFPV